MKWEHFIDISFMVFGLVEAIVCTVHSTLSTISLHSYSDLCSPSKSQNAISSFDIKPKREEPNKITNMINRFFNWSMQNRQQLTEYMVVLCREFGLLMLIQLNALKHYRMNARAMHVDNWNGCHNAVYISHECIMKNWLYYWIFHLISKSVACNFVKVYTCLC